MALRPEQTAELSKLKTYLGEAAIETLQQLPSNSLPAPAKEQLRRIHEHFLGSSDDDTLVDEDFGEGADATATEPNKNNKRGMQAGGRKKGPVKRAKLGAMTRFTKMREIEPLDACFAPYVGDMEAGATRFLNDKATLELHNDRLEPDDNFADAYLVNYKFMVGVENRSKVDQVRYLFGTMNMYAVVGMLNPESSQHHMSDGMCDAVKKFLTATFQGHEERVQEAVKNVQSWNRLGKRLVSLCDAFGEGAIFLLCRHLSLDFLANKFRLDGDVHKEAFEHLAALGLKAKGEETKTTALGQKIRAQLRQPFEQRLNSLAK